MSRGIRNRFKSEGTGGYGQATLRIEDSSYDHKTLYIEVGNQYRHFDLNEATQIYQIIGTILRRVHDEANGGLRLLEGVYVDIEIPGSAKDILEKINWQDDEDYDLVAAARSAVEENLLGPIVRLRNDSFDDVGDNL